MPYLNGFAAAKSVNAVPNGFAAAKPGNVILAWQHMALVNNRVLKVANIPVALVACLAFDWSMIQI